MANSNVSSTPKGLDGPADKKTNTFLSRHQRIEENSKSNNAKVIQSTKTASSKF